MKMRKTVLIKVIAGYMEENAKGVELSMLSLMMPPPKAVSADAMMIPNISRLFFVAIRKPLILKAIIPIISAKIKNSGMF